MKQLTPLSKSLHFQCFNLILSGQVFHVLRMCSCVKLIALHSFLRHKLKLLSKCSVFKARQYIYQFTAAFQIFYR